MAYGDIGTYFPAAVYSVDRSTSGTDLRTQVQFRRTALQSVGLLMAQSRHAQCADECPLLGAKRTWTNRCLPISIYGYTA